MRDARQRTVRKRFQDPLRRWRVSQLLLVLWVQTWESGLIVLKRPSQDKLRDRSHTATERQQVREALNLLVELDTQRRDMDAALEAVENALNAVCVAIAQHRMLQRQPLLPCIGDKGLPATTLTESGDFVLLASEVGDVGAGFLDHPLLAAHRASTPAHVLGFLLDLLLGVALLERWLRDRLRRHSAVR